MIKLAYISEALRIFNRSRHVKKYGIKRYSGNADKICRQIVKDCWNGKYFQTSTGHFCEFYIRDFGFCVDSLLKLGYKKEVRKTLEYAFGIYSRQGLKTTITPSGKAVDIFMYSPDSIAFLMRSIRVSKNIDFIKKYNDFLIKEINKCFNLCFDKKSCLVRRDKYFGGMKDEAKRASSTYDNVMVAMLSDELNKFGFYNPFKKYDIRKAIKNNLWNGRYFYDDIKKFPAATGDSNIFPFWTNVFNDRKMLKSCLTEIQNAGLDKPFPLRYSTGKLKEHKMHFIELFVKNYERNTCWMHMGPLYIGLVKKIDKDKAKEYKKNYKELIEKYHNFLEVFNPDGTPFKSPFYYADEGMLWAANYLVI